MSSGGFRVFCQFRLKVCSPSFSALSVCLSYFILFQIKRGKRGACTLHPLALVCFSYFPQITNPEAEAAPQLCAGAGAAMWV